MVDQLLHPFGEAHGVRQPGSARDGTTVSRSAAATASSWPFARQDQPGEINVTRLRVCVENFATPPAGSGP
jgi:hypothetical protein